jgi:hypothetical protein
MMTLENDFARAIMLLHSAQEALDAAAALEKRREAGSTFLRQITQQERAKTIKEFVGEMNASYSMELD